jgi:DNA-binding MarR family transcriptional regulator
MKESSQLQAIQQLGQTYRTFLSCFEASIGYSMPRWRVLLNLYQSGELSQKDLARRLRIDPAALTRHIKAIESMGWVERHNDPHDNRLTNVALSDLGRKIVHDTLPRRTQFVENAFADMDAEQIQALTELLRTLELHLQSSPATRPGPPVQRDATA